MFVYTRDELTNLNSTSNKVITRPVRKRLFRLKLWNPVAKLITTCTARVFSTFPKHLNCRNLGEFNGNGGNEYMLYCGGRNSDGNNEVAARSDGSSKVAVFSDGNNEVSVSSGGSSGVSVSNDGSSKVAVGSGKSSEVSVSSDGSSEVAVSNHGCVDVLTASGGSIDVAMHGGECSELAVNSGGITEENGSICASTGSADIRFGLWNARSIYKKTNLIAETIIASNLNFFVLTETWHCAGDISISQCLPDGYTMVDQPRSSNSSSHIRGGGIAVAADNSFIVKRLSIDLCPVTFECLVCSLKTSVTQAVLVAVYRPGSAHPSSLFFHEFTALLEELVPLGSQLIIAGDFNIHVDDPDSDAGVRLRKLIDMFGLVQSVQRPTHSAGHTLDLVISRQADVPLTCIIYPPVYSDHGLIIGSFPIPRRYCARDVVKTIRAWKKLSRPAFRDMLRSSPLCKELDQLQELSVDELFDMYELTIKDFVDKLIPLNTIRVRNKPLSPWFDKDCITARRRVRLFERRYRRSNSASDCLSWVREMQKKRVLLERKESSYWNSKILSLTGQPKKLWRNMDKLLARDSKTGNISTSISAEILSSCFCSKVADIRKLSAIAEPPTFTVRSKTNLFEFEPVTMEDVRKVICESQAKSCSLDPIPTTILREFLDDLLPFVWLMCSKSLREARLPVSQKHAIVTPILKKAGLDPDDPKNYRPISNLTYMSKVIERLVSSQLSKYLHVNSLLPVVQSAYRSGHSTETAVLKVFSDIYDALDSGKITLLGLLDLSAAFDTVDHAILLERLERSYGLGGRVLDWLRSFVCDRRQTVSFNGISATTVDLLYGVPQGSVLGPLLFTMYTADVCDIAVSHGLGTHAYADDQQSYVHCRPSDAESAVVRFKAYFSDVEEWMTRNRLKLNPDKTEFIWFGSRLNLRKINIDTIELGSNTIKVSNRVRNLGVFLDSELNLDSHVAGVVRSCFHQIRQLRSIRRCLTPDAMKTLAHAFICSRVDYCNSILLGSTNLNHNRLQSVLNAAARLITGLRKFDHISDTLQDLHWLRVPERCQFKVASITRRCLEGLGPGYLNCNLVPVSSVAARSHLRSADSGDLVVPRARTATAGRRSYRFTGPTTWNSLPPGLRNLNISHGRFVSDLKTHLFPLSFNC